MKIFVSYSAEQRPLAERIASTLRAEGHHVFFDRDSLKPGEAAFDMRIRREIKRSDVMLFLVSPSSVRSGSYALTELSTAQQLWAKAHTRVIPVIAEATPIAQIPGFLRSITFFEATGELVAELSRLLNERAQILKRRRLGIWAVVTISAIAITLAIFQAPALHQFLGALKEDPEIVAIFNSHSTGRYLLPDEWAKLSGEQRVSFEKYLLARISTTDDVLSALSVVQASEGVLSAATRARITDRLTELASSMDPRVRQKAVRNLFFVHNSPTPHKVENVLYNAMLDTDLKVVEYAITSSAAVIESGNTAPVMCKQLLSRAATLEGRFKGVYPDPVMFFYWKVLPKNCLADQRHEITLALVDGTQSESLEVARTALYGLGERAAALPPDEISAALIAAEKALQKKSSMIGQVLEFYGELVEPHSFRTGNQARIIDSITPPHRAQILNDVLKYLDDESDEIRKAAWSALSRIASIVSMRDHSRVLARVVSIWEAGDRRIPRPELDRVVANYTGTVPEQLKKQLAEPKKFKAE